MKKRGLFELPGLLCFGLMFVATQVHAAAGNLDPTFGNGGTVVNTLVPVANSSSIALPEAIQFQSNGDILLLVAVTITGADASSTTRVLRYTSAGVLDSAFGGSGSVTLPTAFAGSAMAVDSTDRIVVVGTDSDDLAALRLTADGALDATFGTDGVATTKQSCCGAAGTVLVEPSTVATGANDILFCSALPPTGKKRPTTTFLARWTSGGILDSTFGEAGIVNVTAVNGCSAAALLSTGEIVVENSETAQFEPNGTLESSVTGGTILATSASQASGTNNIFQPNGNFLTAQALFVGEESRSHNASTQVLRFTITGAADSTFADPSFHFAGSGGSGIEATPDAIAVEPNGDIVVVGEQSTATQSGTTLVNGLARLTSSGDLDTTFGTGGTETNTVPSTTDGFTLVAIDAQGNIVTAGIADSFTQIFLSRYLGE